MVLTAAALRTRAAGYREFAGSVAGQSTVLGEDVATADGVAATAVEQSQSPRMDHDVLRYAAYVNEIRGMPDAATAVALTFHAVANDIDRFAGWREGIDAALVSAETPDDVQEANRAMVRLDAAFDEACVLHARAIARAALPLEQAFAASGSGFSAPVISDRADYLVALAGVAAGAGVDVTLLGYNPVEIRTAIEADFGEFGGEQLLIGALQGSSGPVAAAYWNTLTDEERGALIQERPDLAAKALQHGGTFSETELDQLDRANSYPVFTEEIAAAFEVSLGLRGVCIEIGGGYEVAAIKMSDGTVQVAVGRTSSGGIGGEVPTLRGDVEATAGVFASATVVFVFPNEAAAAAAIEDLRSHAQTSWMDRFDSDMFGLPVSNDEVDDVVEGLWADYGMSRTESGGIYANFEADLDQALAVKEIEVELSVAEYDTTTTSLAGEPGREGVIVAGALRLDADGSAPGGSVGAVETAAGVSGGVEAAFTIDVYTTADGEEFMTITLQGSATGGLLSALEHPGTLDAEIETAMESGAQVTVEMTMPVDSASGAAVSDIVELLLNEGGDGNAFSLVGREDQEITVTIDAVTERSLDVEADIGGVAEVDYELTNTTTRNIETWHKLPDGEIYSQTEVDQMIGAQLGEQPAPSMPEWTEPEAEMTDAELNEAIMGGSDAAWLDDNPSDPDGNGITSVQLVDAAHLAADVTGAPPPDLDHFPIRDAATAADYAAVLDSYGPDASVAYDQAGRPLYIDTGHGETIELNDSDYPARPEEP